ncbi:hypothetical protein HPB50_024904 [Hyalomma asiaticum]|uniref:Uncharacterized protein n=1 Tax=Hyalomma asiaticum TaxID=266040 RepID=A0ACB7T6S5_HYAAI|nr:hypothetical protein HPB50_024904 [Hyalomma asiaticum]
MVSHTDESTDVDIDVDDIHARHLRPRRRTIPAATFCCPVCGVTLREHELQQHWQLEVDRLQGIARNVARRHRSDSTPAVSSSRTNARREQSLERVRANHDRRRRREEDVHCPVCQIGLQGSPELLSEHVNRCLSRHDGDLMDEDDDVDVDGIGVGESFDEYEWAGQRRLRATSLLEGGFRAALWAAPSTSGSSSNNSAATATASAANEDEDVDLDVDGDAYGRAQYPCRERKNLIPLESSEPAEERERRLLRQAVVSSSGSVGRSSTSLPRRDEDHSSTVERPEAARVGKPVSDGAKEARHTGPDLTKEAMFQVVQSLRERLRKLECETQAVSKCLICLGAKKLCPQCNSITGASDLRRIYL